jgi:transposase-like protein
MSKQSEILSIVSGLNESQKRMILRHLHLDFLLGFEEGDDVTLFKDYVSENPHCPDCDSEHIKKNGHYRGKQRFVCKACSRSLGLLTGTCVHGIHKKKLWTAFVELSLESKSIRYISKKLSLSVPTVFDWRHKLLSSLSEIFSKEFHGIVEMDDVMVRLNQKGRRKDFI